MLKIKELIWAIKRFWYLFIILPGALAAAVIFLTRNTEKIYDSNTIIYTGISTRKSADLTESLKIDYFTSNNLMDNIVALINSRKTAEFVSLKLIAQHLSLKPGNPKYFSNETYEELKNHIPESLWKKLAVNENPEATFKNLIKAFENEDDEYSPLRYVLDKHKYYGVTNISNRTRVIRQKSSDMVEISYYTDDPGIVYQTLKLIAEVYLQRYSDLRTIENSGSIDFYIAEKDRVFQKLQEAEERLKIFVSENRIMNFYEQGKNLDNYLNDLEKDLTRSNQISKGADASLKILEEKMIKNQVRSSLIDSLETYRKQVSSKRLTLNTLLLESSLESEVVLSLKKEIRDINDLLSSKINELYLQDFSIDGIPITLILGEWLDTYLEKEKELSGLEVSLASFQLVSDRIDNFAPLGAELKRLEREVGINENEYLYILSGLNQARLQTQNLKISQTQEIIDPPFFPTAPRGSKRKILVLASFMFGHIILIGFFAGKLLLNSSLQEHYNAEKITGLDVMASFPKVQSHETSIYFQTSAVLLSNQLAALAHRFGEKPSITIAIHPVSEDEDFPLILKKSIELLPTYLQPVKLFSTMSIEGFVQFNELDYLNTPNLSTFLKNFRGDEDLPIINFILLPPYRKLNYNLELLKDIDWNIFYAQSSYVWKGSDGIVVDWLKEWSANKVGLVLTKVDINFIKDMNKEG